MHVAVRLGAFGRHVRRGQLEHTARLMAKTPPAVEAKGDFAMMRWQVTDRLPAIRLPTLVVVGERDLVTRPDAGETIAGLIPGAKLERMEGCGHMGFYEYNEAYDRAIADFASGLLNAPSGVSGATDAGGSGEGLSTSAVRVH